MSLAEPAVQSTMCLLKETKTTSQSSPAYQRGSLVGSGREMWLHISNTISGGRLSFPFADSIISVWGGGGREGTHIRSLSCQAQIRLAELSNPCRQSGRTNTQADTHTYTWAMCTYVDTSTASHSSRSRLKDNLLLKLGNNRNNTNWSD